MPLNDELARTGEPVWPRYRARWTALNTLRGVLTLAAAGLLAA